METQATSILIGMAISVAIILPIFLLCLLFLKEFFRSQQNTTQPNTDNSEVRNELLGIKKAVDYLTYESRSLNMSITDGDEITKDLNTSVNTLNERVMKLLKISSEDEGQDIGEFFAPFYEKIEEQTIAIEQMRASNDVQSRKTHQIISEMVKFIKERLEDSLPSNNPINPFEETDFPQYVPIDPFEKVNDENNGDKRFDEDLEELLTPLSTFFSFDEKDGQSNYTIRQVFEEVLRIHKGVATIMPPFGEVVLDDLSDYHEINNLEWYKKERKKALDRLAHSARKGHSRTNKKPKIKVSDKEINREIIKEYKGKEVSTDLVGGKWVIKKLSDLDNCKEMNWYKEAYKKVKTRIYGRKHYQNKKK